MIARFFHAVGLVLATAPFAFPQPGKIDFNRDVRPILSNNCFACHGPDEKVRKGDLRLDTRDGAIANAIVPGKPEASTFIERITSKDANEAMPPAKFATRRGPSKRVFRSAAYRIRWRHRSPHLTMR